MYSPKYNITDKLLANVVKLELIRESSKSKAIDYNLRIKLNFNNKALSLFHLSRLVGLNITLKEAEKLAEGRRLEQEEEKLRLLANYRNVLEFNRSPAAESYIGLDPSVFMHLNKLLLTTWRDSWEVKYRGVGESAHDLYDHWVGYALPEMDGEKLEAELVAALEWYQGAAVRTNLLIRFGVLLYRLVELAPMLMLNQLTLISVADLVLHQEGYTSGSHLPVVKVFADNQEELAKAIEVSKHDYDITFWLEKFTELLARENIESKIQIDQALSEEEEKHSAQPFLDLNKRQLKVLRYLQTIPTVKREDYCQMMEVSTMTAFRDLNDLVRKKLIKVEGQGRGTRYMLVSR